MALRDYYDPLWHLPHYYGDTVRRIFIASAAVILAASPIYSDSVADQFIVEIIGALILVICAAFTNPRSFWIFFANSLAAAMGVVIFQAWAISAYTQTSAVTPIVFVIREVLAVALLFALYFSVKTLRAMQLHQIGEEDEEGRRPDTYDKYTEDSEEEGESSGDSFGIEGEYGNDAHADENNY
jgi:hypothetical protein